MPRALPRALPALSFLLATSSPDLAQAQPAPDAGAARAAPNTALWVGARAGYEVPVGAAFTDLRDDRYQERDLLGPGPSLEVDVGGRFGKRFLPFIYVSHTFARLGAADRPPPSGSIKASLVPDLPPASRVNASSSTLIGLGLRYAFYAFGTEAVGLVAEVAYGYRLTRTKFDDGTLLRAGSPGEFRIALGAELRLSSSFSLSPMVRVSTGSYSDVTVENSSGEKNALGGGEAHGFLGLELGGHFDLFGKYD